MHDDVMNLKQLCTYLKLEEKKVKGLVFDKSLPAFRSRGELRFRKIEVDDWLQQNMVEMSEEQLHKMEGEPHRDEDPPGGRSLVSPLLHGEAIELGFRARTKPSLLRELAHLAEATGLVYDVGSLTESLRERENLCSTALEDGVAIPHPRIRQEWVLEESLVVIVTVVGGLPFGAPDGKLSDLFFVPLCADDTEHLQVLARLCRMLQSDSFLDGMRTAVSVPEVMELITTREDRVIEEWLKNH